MTGFVRSMFERFIPERQEETLRLWAAEHAYSLVFITFLFIVTWALIVIDILVGVR